MTSDAQRAFDEALRQNFPTFLRKCVLTVNPGAPFLPNWHIDAIAYRLEQVRRGEIKRLIINMPPRSLKSLMVSVAFPAFVLGHDPRCKLFGISYGSDLVADHTGKFRSIVESAWYRRAFPGMQIKRSTETEVQTTSRGFRRATSVNAALTGLGGKIFIIDDPQKPVDAQSEAHRNQLNQWSSNTLMSRLDNKETGAIILVMQRVHLNDLTGFLTEQSDDWAVLSLPAIAEVDEQVPIGDGTFHVRRAGEAMHPERESVATLEKLRRSMSSDDFAAQYQQSPVPPGGAMIKRDWLRYYEAAPARGHRTKVIQSWDTAAKDGAQNDWSVCTTWLLADKHFYLLDLVRGRYEYPRLKDTAIALAQRFKPDTVLIEDASTGIALAQELRKIVPRPVKPIPVHRDKGGRLYVHQAKFEAGLVLFPKGAKFLPELETELLTFPQGRTDDQVDSISQALSYERPGYDSTYSWL